MRRTILSTTTEEKRVRKGEGANDGGVVSHQSEADVPGGRGFGGRRTERGQ